MGCPFEKVQVHPNIDKASWWGLPAMDGVLDMSRHDGWVLGGDRVTTVSQNGAKVKW